MSERAVLDIADLHVRFRTPFGRVSALRGLSLRVDHGMMVGLVGESGCGKSITGRTSMRLLPRNAEAEGQVVVAGHDILGASEEELRRIRGREVGMIFQDPSGALNPITPIGKLLTGILSYHQLAEGAEARARVMQLLDEVGLARPRELMRRYPHELSGGMQQRVVIAMALACHPQLIIADEPTTALDATVQAQILELLMRLQATRKLAVLMITHNLSVVGATCERVSVVYAGQVVESGVTRVVLERPLHPYSAALLAARPGASRRKQPLPAIPGAVPSARTHIAGCPFAPRCPLAMPKCVEQRPPMRRQGEEDRAVACWAVEEEEAA